MMKHSNDISAFNCTFSVFRGLQELGLAVVLGISLVGPSMATESSCEDYLAAYYTGHEAPHEMVTGYANSKSAFSQVVRQGNKVVVAAVRLSHETQIGIDPETRTAVLEVAQEVLNATSAANRAADRAEAARTLWVAIEADNESRSALDAVNVEHAAFMSAVNFTQVSNSSVIAFMIAATHVGMKVDTTDFLDVFETLMDAEDIDGIYESLIGLEVSGISGVNEFVNAFRAFHKAINAAGVSAKDAAITLERGSSVSVCQN